MAVSQSGAGRYLLAVSGTPGKEDCIGRVLDLAQGILFPDFPFDSILARGYWVDYKGSQDLLAELLPKVRRVDDPKKLKQAMDEEKRRRAA